MDISTFGNIDSANILIQMVGEHELSFLEKEVEYIKDLAGTDDFGLMAVKVENWNRDLSPWEVPAVFGDEPSGGRAEQTLEELKGIIDSELLRGRDASDINLYIGGYSLSGLFALWSVYNVNYFKGAAAVSPSVWFPGFDEYISGRDIGSRISAFLTIIEVKSMDDYGFLNELSDKTLYTGLTASEIERYAGEFSEAFNVSLPEDVRAFLSITNGLYINGKVFLSMINDNVKELSPRATNRTRDIIGFNKSYRDMTDIEDYIILGKDSISYFVYDIASEKYQVLSNGTLDVMSEYNSLARMIREVLVCL